MKKPVKAVRLGDFQNQLGSIFVCLLVALIPFFKYYQAYPYVLGFSGLLLSVFAGVWLGQVFWRSFQILPWHLFCLMVLGLLAASLNEVLLNLLGRSNLIWFALISVYGVLYLGPSYIWKSVPCLVLSFVGLKFSVNHFEKTSFDQNTIQIIFITNYLSSVFGLTYACYFLLNREPQIQAELVSKEAIEGDRNKMGIISGVNQNIVRKFLDPLKVIIQANSALMKLAPVETANLEKISVGITNSSARILNITKSLLKISGDEKASHSENVSLNEMIEDAVHSFKQSRSMDYLKFKVKGSSRGLSILANRHEFREVLFVLLQNSFESTQKVGSKKIDIELYRQGKKAIVSITDSGAGISSDVKDHIFNPFFSTKEIGGGTGLGLSVAAGVVESLGGTLRLASPMPGKCIFLIELPMADRDRL